jgi:hypothetical protein
LIAGVLAAAPGIVRAQAADAPLPPAAGRGAFQAGWQTLDLGALNRDLRAAGYPAFDEGLFTLGGFGLGTSGRFLIGGEGHGLVTREETTPDGTFRTRLSGGYGLFTVGYLAARGPRWDLYPLVGVGGGGLSLEIVERSSPTFDDVLTEPGRSSRLSTGGVLVDLGLGADLRFADGPGGRDEDDDNDEGVGGLFVGLRAGWLWSPGDWQWELDELNDVAGGPGTDLTGFYIRVSLGGWGGERPGEAQRR